MVYQLVMQERTNVLVVQLFKDWKIEKKKRLGCQFILLVFTIYNGLYTCYDDFELNFVKLFSVFLLVICGINFIAKDV